MGDIPRAETSRKATERVADERRFSPEGRGILHVDESDIPHDYKLMWAREYVLGRHDPDNITKALDEGYEPVPASEMPHYVPPSLDENRAAPKYIRRGGMILLRKPMAMAKADEAAMREHNRRVLMDVDRDRAQSSHPHMPAMRPELERKIERNSKRFADDQ